MVRQSTRDAWLRSGLMILFIVCVIGVLFLPLTMPWLVFWTTMSWVFGWQIFSNSRNLVQSWGPIYWVIGDAIDMPTPGAIVQVIEKAPPWRRGRGLAVNITDRTMIQLGFCRRHDVRNVDQQLGVRLLDWDADTIDNRLTNRWQMGKRA